MRSVVAALVSCVALAVALPVSAQTMGRPRPASGASGSTPGFHAFVFWQDEQMAADQSFKAILGSSSQASIGVGGEATGLWQGLFVRVAYSQFSKTGSRVFVDASQNVIPLHVPLTIEIKPLEIGAGWRFTSKRTQTVAIVPYAGGGLLQQKYRETSSFADSSENVSATDTGGVVFGGVEVGVKFVKVGFEGQYRTVPNKLGTGGVSDVFNEKNLGGAVFRVTFGVGF